MAVKLNQPLSELYNLPFFEYSIYLTVINQKIKKRNAEILAELEEGPVNMPGRLG
jgi:hypothetical protein